MAIHNKSHHNSGLMQLNRMGRKNMKNRTAADFPVPAHTGILHVIMDSMDFLKKLPDESVDFILIDPPYNLDLEDWDTYGNYMEWAAGWIDEACRVLSPEGNMAVFGGTQFRDARSGDLIEIIYHCRHNTKFKLINTIIWHYKNGMSAHRYFANRHEEIIWLAKTDRYYFDLDSVRVAYPEKELELALKDKRLNPENVRKGKNPTNVWDIGRLNGNSLERVGHPTQKPLELIRRLVKSLSFPGAVVLDFFAGSGTTGRVCIEEKRNCIMCDNDPMSKEYFAGHISRMEKGGNCFPYISYMDIESFYAGIQDCNVHVPDSGQETES